MPLREPDAAPVRLIVRRVKPAPGSQLALFATYSYHGFITDRDGETLELEADHRRHAEIENAIRDLKYGVGLNPTDYGQFTPMLEQAEETTGTKACMTLADAGYYSGSNLSECAGRGQGVAMPETSQRQSRGHPYHKDRFAYDESSDSFMCPQGKALPFERIHISSKGAHFRFYRAPISPRAALPPTAPGWRYR